MPNPKLPYHSLFIFLNLCVPRKLDNLSRNQVESKVTGFRERKAPPRPIVYSTSSSASGNQTPAKASFEQRLKKKLGVCRYSQSESICEGFIGDKMARLATVVTLVVLSSPSHGLPVDNEFKQVVDRYPYN